MKQIDFKTTPEEHMKIQLIAERAVNKYQEMGYKLNKLHSAMDITAVHLNGCSLDLDKLLEAPDFDFIHDVAGIARHLNRSTGELEGFFIPRYAKKGASM
ncbi:hypothetical protein [Desulfitobacterium hafniense]|uniref:DUF6874 family protein n=1 Tax=Desulfitobacterium hafniense TaxID=49338 RepID=UPI0012F7C313|nr:hypothetical protein [Desulfitobacterium hafniense]